MSDWTPPGKRAFAQGITHSCARLGNAITPPLVAWLMVAVTWRGSFVILGIISMAWAIAWGWYFRDNPGDHPVITQEELETLPPYASRDGRLRIPVPWLSLTRRMLPVIVVYFCYGWTLWLYLAWIPQFFLHSYRLDLKSSALFSDAWNRETHAELAPNLHHPIPAFGLTAPNRQLVEIDSLNLTVYETVADCGHEQLP